ncbi:hypothetical protein FISHEDRAFT_37436 [Fistulina hepatica ATCC 64428]|uniref:Nucleolar 27S pre-rRNA processing Urb2/Npa2 C-terminal domain-containing protein n=1 Tax=Fistulina hepatica ATCC 64428 TaxID=1128425 RepID=A0A0D7AJC3_9AGAR|nr:hypothetical protein FISHEDRAFT_37436 [Fistulina hepatica ATCC 64428]
MQLEALLTCYVVFSSSSTSNSGQSSFAVHDSCLTSSAEIASFDALFLSVCKTLPVSDYRHALDFLSDAIVNTDASNPRMINVVHLASVMLANHPQIFITTCLGRFADSDHFIHGPLALRLEVLGLLVGHCAERPAAVRQIDLGSVWIILLKMLSPTSSHDTSTSPAFFHGIVGIVGALIRLRRDLLISTLPHVSMILCFLVSALRSSRTVLGPKQARLVGDTLPQWVDVQQPLGADEARALARLLESLRMKTAVRTHAAAAATGEISQRLESLAKPFSRHAAPILMAYAEALNEPLCVLATDVRKELLPGLYALCDMLNDHSRDAMMVSIPDAGGKAAIKSLWKDYQRQKYVGKG